MKAHFYIVSYTVNKNLKTCWENDQTKTERQLQNPKSSNKIPYMTNNEVKWTLAFLVKYCVITNINMYIPIHIATRATCHPWIKILVLKPYFRGYYNFKIVTTLANQASYQNLIYIELVAEQSRKNLIFFIPTNPIFNTLALYLY